MPLGELALTFRLGDSAVRDDRQIALCCQNVRRAPVHLDDPAIGAGSMLIQCPVDTVG